MVIECITSRHLKLTMLPVIFTLHHLTLLYLLLAGCKSLEGRKTWIRSSHLHNLSTYRINISYFASFFFLNVDKINSAFLLTENDIGGTDALLASDWSRQN